MSMGASEVKGMSALDNVKTPDADSHAFRLSTVLRTMFMCWAFTCVYTIKSSNVLLCCHSCEQLGCGRHKGVR